MAGGKVGKGRDSLLERWGWGKVGLVLEGVWWLLRTGWTSWTASMNDSVSAASPLALRIEMWTFHSSNRVMLRFPLQLP